MIVVVDAAWSGEVANRLRGVGRFHPSRTVVCAVEPGRTTLDAVASVAGDVDDEVRDGPSPMRELVVVRCGEGHLASLDTIVDPIVVTDLTTLLWAPHGHGAAVDALLGLCQVVLLDSVDHDDVADALGEAHRLAAQAYVVDLAWLRSTPWRERVAATFDPGPLRPELRRLDALTVRHHPASEAAALLFAGWLAAQLGWSTAPLERGEHGLAGRADCAGTGVAIALEPAPEQSVRGLAGVELSSASGRWLRFDRGPGGLRAHYRREGGAEREWTIMGASRGEAGILGEGIRQALLRDPTYAPALAAPRADRVSLHVLVTADADEAAGACAEALASLLRAALAERGTAHLALNGGSGPRVVYERLGALPLDWAACTSGSATSAACPPATRSPTTAWRPRR